MKLQLGSVYGKPHWFMVEADSLPPTVAPKPGWKWVMGKTGKWYQVKVGANIKKPDIKVGAPQGAAQPVAKGSPQDGTATQKPDNSKWLNDLKQTIEWADQYGADLFRTQSGTIHTIAITKDGKVYDKLNGYEGNISINEYKQKHTDELKPISLDEISAELNNNPSGDETQ